MAVNSSKKKNISNNKSKNTSPKKTKNIKEKKDENKKRNNYLVIYLLIISLLFITFGILLIPRIKITGGDITIRYNDQYKEPGYNAKILFRDITKKVKVKSNIESGKVGDYYIKYYVRFGFLNVKKIRNVKVIDNVRPVIESADEIKVCPNKKIDKIEYRAIDEYDGDITNNVKEKRLDDKIVLSAQDSSNNKITKEIAVVRKDDEAPKITLKGDTTVYLLSGKKYIESGYSVVDNCDGDISDKVTITGNVGSSVGTYKLNYSVTDSSNNKSEVTRTVIIYQRVVNNSGSIKNGVIYLTFDDGPNWGTTNVILDVLKEEGVKATFFVTCNGPDSLIKRMYDEGHTVALHTSSHNYATVYSSVDAYFNDLNTVSNRVERITGMKSMIIRFPGGSSNIVSKRYKEGIMTDLTNLVLSRGYHYFDWNVDSGDAGGASSSQQVYNNVTKNLSKSRANVVLMHDIKTITRDAIRSIIQYGYSQGYGFDKITMDTYMVRHGVNN